MNTRRVIIFFSTCFFLIGTAGFLLRVPFGFGHFVCSINTAFEHLPTPAILYTPRPISLQTILNVTSETYPLDQIKSPMLKLDLAVVIALASFIVSVMTLYVAHLKGANINLAVPGKVYPCHGIQTQTLRHLPKDDSVGHYVLKSNLLIANTGNRSGVLYSFRVDPLYRFKGFWTQGQIHLWRLFASLI